MCLSLRVMSKGPTIIIRGGKPHGRTQIERVIRTRDGKWLSRNLSKRDKLDILMDSSTDAERREVSGILASKLPDSEVLEAIDKMNRWTDGTDEAVRRGKVRRRKGQG